MRAPSRDTSFRSKPLATGGFRTGGGTNVYVGNNAPGEPAARQEARPPGELPLRGKNKRKRTGGELLT